MRVLLHKRRPSTFLIKIASLIIGYAIWSMLNQNTTREITVETPICFYNQKETDTIACPESVAISICGSKKELDALDTHALAIHVNTEKLCYGANSLSIDSEKLFLPPTLKLVHYTPSNITLLKSEIRNEITSELL